MQQFDVIFKIFGRAVFEAIEVKGPLMLNFEATTIISESLAANPEKVRQTSV